jgi:hypothetical protein
VCLLWYNALWPYENRPSAFTLVSCLTLEIEDICFSETSVTTPTTRRYTLQDYYSS